MSTLRNFIDYLEKKNTSKENHMRIMFFKMYDFENFSDFLPLYPTSSAFCVLFSWLKKHYYFSY